MENKDGVRVFLLLGAHGNIGDAENAINKIKKIYPEIKNENKILLIECSGWAFGMGFFPKLTSDYNNEEFDIIFRKIAEHYNECEKKIRNGDDLTGEEKHWLTEIYKFGYDSGYFVFREIPNQKNTKEIFAHLENIFNMNLQRKRDTFFIHNQLIPLLKKYPNKIIIVLRGLEHEKILNEILFDLNIRYNISYYESSIIKEKIDYDKIHEELMRGVFKKN